MANSYTACRISIMVDMSQISTEPWFHFSKYLIISIYLKQLTANVSYMRFSDDTEPQSAYFVFFFNV